MLYGFYLNRAIKINKIKYKIKQIGKNLKKEMG